jgi:putative chitinase
MDGGVLGCRLTLLKIFSMFSGILKVLSLKPWPKAGASPFWPSSASRMFPQPGTPALLEPAMLPTEQLLIRAYEITGGRARRFALPIREACLVYQINTIERLAMFLATIGHESALLRYTRELWGPTPEQRRYEGRKDLGNVRAGDGIRYLGRGLIQTTGRANYAMTRGVLRQKFNDVPDFEADPAQLEDPRWAALSAGAFWERKLLNQIADAGDFLRLSIRVNGKNASGLPNHWQERQQLYGAAKAALTS